MSAILGGVLNPTSVTPTIGTSLQQAFFDALFGLGTSGSGSNTTLNGLPAFPGATTNPNTSSTAPNVNNTILPNVYNNWEPWNEGNEYIATALSNGSMNPTQVNPFLAPLINNGGPSGPGTTAMNNIMNYGTPSSGIGQEMQNLAQFGAAGPAGDALAALAQGQTTGAAQYMAPFLTGNYSPMSSSAQPTISMPKLGVGGGA
jgi:hypothetical protein